MKKLMIAVTVACVSIALNAAQFAWKTSYSHVVDHSGNEIKTSADYNALMGGSGDNVGKIVLVLLKDGTYSGDMTVLTGTSGDVATYKSSGSGSIKYGLSTTYGFNVATSSLADGDKIGVMYMDKDGALSQLVAWDKENNKAGDKIDSIYTISGLDDFDPKNSWSGADFVFGNAGTQSAVTYFTTQAVPEPTSAMLLLLGVAGLALRRRRA